MTPLLAALSRLCDAARIATVAASTSPVSAASRNLRTAVFSDDLTALLRCRAFSFCLLRLIWDLIFATRKPRSGSGLVAWGATLRRGRISQPAARAQTSACQRLVRAAQRLVQAAQRLVQASQRLVRAA